MHEPVIISLSAFDLQYIAMYAERQRCVKRATGVNSKKYDKNKSEYELHYIGAMGEFAVAKHLVVPLDEAVYAIGDDGTDLMVNGWKCHVKTFAFPAKRIDYFIDGMNEFTADVGIFAQVLSPVRVKVAGCISRARFESTATVKNYGYGDRLKVVDEDLIPAIKLLSVQGTAK